MNISIGRIEQVVEIHSTIPEFNKPSDVNYFKARFDGRDSIIFIAEINEKAIGYMISYDRYNDGSIYCWMAGVNPKFRKNKALYYMMQSLENWSIENGFNSIKIKTSNRRKEMLKYLVSNNFLITKVYNETQEKKIIDNRIDFEKTVIKNLN